MIFPLGKDLQPWVDFLSLPINDNDILIVVRNSDLSKPLAIRWKEFKTFLVASGAISVSEDGTVVVNQASNLNFVGAGVSVSEDGTTATITIPGGSGSGPTLQTDGVDNEVQLLLNLIAGKYIDLTADSAGGVTMDVVGILSSEIVTFNLGDGPITITDQSDNHATQINMGVWDGLSPFSIVYNTKTDPKDGAILEVEISDTFATDASPAGPGSVNLEIKYGSTTIFNESVDADRAIRFRYEADSDVWFPISYTTVTSQPGGAYTVNNGLTENPANNFQLGGTTLGSAPLLHNTYIDSDGFMLILSGSTTGNIPNLYVSNDGISSGNLAGAIVGSTSTLNGKGVAGIHSGSGGIGAGLQGFSTNGYGLLSNSINNYGAYIISENNKPLYLQKTIGNNSSPDVIISLKAFASSPVIGNGTSIEYYGSLTGATTNDIIGHTNVITTDIAFATRTGQYEIHLYNNAVEARVLALTGSGQLILDNYITATSFQSVSGASVGVLNVDNTGKVFVGTGGGGSGTVTSVGLSVPAPANPAFIVSGSPVTGSGTLAIAAAGATSDYVRGDGSLKTFPQGSFGVNTGNGQTVILPGQVGYWTAPCDGTITDWAIQGSTANGTIQFDIWKATGTLPTVSDSIVGAGTKPYLTAERYRTEAATFDDLTFSAGDVFGYYVDSNATLTWAALQIFYNKS